MPFIGEDFLLQTKAAQRLYHRYAERRPILDYHNHLSANEIAEDRRFENLAEIWLEGDHYKWRAMRANGVPERLITGDAPPYEKLLAWARTVPATVRNPLYHWTHLELLRYFGIGELLNEKSAPAIWERANELLRTPDLSARGILAKFRVAALCTTDDPADDLRWHRKVAEAGLATRLYPAFRPDKALAVDNLPAFNAWVDKLALAANIEIESLTAFMEALDRRHLAFHAIGCRLSDHGLPHCHSDFPSQSEAAATFARARTGQPPSEADRSRFGAYMMVFFGRLDVQRGWTKQLHLGPQRNANPAALARIGPDAGFDSIGDWPQAQALASYLGRLASQNALPRMILYNNNPADNYVFASMAGNFQVQFGSGWWFLDTKQGIEWQLDALSNIGLLSRFIGMTTDSRSVMSFPRHEYFRRVLCNLIGGDIEAGLIPDDESLVGPMIEAICFENARAYLGLEASTVS